MILPDNFDRRALPARGSLISDRRLPIRWCHCFTQNRHEHQN